METEVKLTTEQILDLMKESNITNRKHRSFLLKLLETKKAAESWMEVYGVTNKSSAYSASSRVLNLPEIKAFMLAYEIASTRILRQEISPLDLVREQYKLALDPSDDNKALAKSAREWLLNWMGANSMDLMTFLDLYESEKKEDLLLIMSEMKGE